MVTGLLLLAFVFFVFAQAATTRSDGQSAADAAALAAAHEARDHLYDRFLDDLGGDGELDDILAGEEFPTESACDEAAPRLAARNNADVASCGPDHGRRGYTVGVETRNTVGASVIPGTESQTAYATATAVIDARCEVTTDEEDLTELSCDDKDWSFDPDDEDELPEARDLFDVYLDD